MLGEKEIEISLWIYLGYGWTEDTDVRPVGDHKEIFRYFNATEGEAKTKRAFLEPIMLFYFQETTFLWVWKAFEVLWGGHEVACKIPEVKKTTNKQTKTTAKQKTPKKIWQEDSSNRQFPEVLAHWILWFPILHDLHWTILISAVTDYSWWLLFTYLQFPDYYCPVLLRGYGWAAGRTGLPSPKYNPLGLMKPFWGRKRELS